MRFECWWDPSSLIGRRDWLRRASTSPANNRSKNPIWPPNAAAIVLRERSRAHERERVRQVLAEDPLPGCARPLPHELAITFGNESNVKRASSCGRGGRAWGRLPACQHRLEAYAADE